MMQETDPELQKGLRWVLDNDITDILFSTFSVESDVANSGADAAGAASDETKSSDAGGGKAGEDSDSSADGAGAQVVDLVPGGRDIDVSEQNKKQYVELMAAWRAGGEAQEAVDAFVEGVHEVCVRWVPYCDRLVLVQPVRVCPFVWLSHPPLTQLLCACDFVVPASCCQRSSSPSSRSRSSVRY